MIDGGRSQEKCRETLQEIARVAQVAPQILLCDFSSMQDVQRAAKEFLASGEPLHVLVNNAGAVYQSREITRDGFEATFGVNHLGPFQFTLMLLPLLKQNSPARIVNVASEAHKFGGPIDFNDINMVKSYGAMKAYGRSKLANIFFTQGLAERLQGTGVTVNCVHPGAVATNLGGNNNKLLVYVMHAFMKLFFRTPEKGAETSIYLASSTAVEGISGRYFFDCKEKALGKPARDTRAKDQLWALSEKLTGIQFI